MENGPSIYYSRNTVKAPHPGKKRRAQYLNKHQSAIPFEGKNMADNSHKVCAVTKCVWCGHNPGQYFITCANCSNCQYCGMVDNVDPYRCYLCGNYLPEDARTELVKFTPDNVRNVTAKLRRKGYVKTGVNATIKSVK